MTLDRGDAEGSTGATRSGFRDRFVFTAPERIYADGNSLGRPPLETVERMESIVCGGAKRLVGRWEDWIELPSASASGSVK